MPIINSVAVAALGSEPEKARIAWVVLDDVRLYGDENYQLYVFTAMAGKYHGAENDQRYLPSTELSWGDWALTAGCRGIVMLWRTAGDLHTMYPPEIKGR